MERLKEGKTEFFAESKDIVDSKMSVFYNPKMRENRELSILVLLKLIRDKASSQKGSSLIKVKIAFPLCGSGLRPLRLLTEHSEMIEDAISGSSVQLHIFVNDINDSAVEAAKRSFDNDEVSRLLKLKNFNLEFSCLNAHEFLHKNRHFDYIELDPFGSPNEFLDTALRCTKDGAILSVTATDTAALTGTYPKTTLWKYWSTAVKMPTMHEISLRILSRKVIMQASPYAKAAIPLLSYYNLHYIKSFFLIKKSKKLCYEQMLRMHRAVCLRNTGILLGCEGGEINEAGINDETKSVGPLYFGDIMDHSFITELYNMLKEFNITYNNKSKDINNYRNNNNNKSGFNNSRDDSNNKNKNKNNNNNNRIKSNNNYNNNTNNNNIFSRKLVSDFDIMKKESLFNSGAYYFDIHQLSSALGKSSVQKSSSVIGRIIKEGFNASRSIFGDNLIRTDIPVEKLLSIV